MCTACKCSVAYESGRVYHRECRRACSCKRRRALKHKSSRSRGRSRCRVRDSSLAPCHLHLAGMSLPGCLALAMDTRSSASSIPAPGITARPVSISYQDDTCICTSASLACPRRRGVHVTRRIQVYLAVVLEFLGV